MVVVYGIFRVNPGKKNPTKLLRKTTFAPWQYLENLGES